MKADERPGEVLPQGIHIRPARREDAEALLALYCEVHDTHLAAMPDDFAPLSPEAEARLLKEFIDTDPSRIHVAEREGGLVGCVRIQARERARKRYVYVDMLVVSPKWQARGVGHALMESVHCCAASLGASDVELEVYEFNTAGLRLYEGLGYRAVSRRLKRPLAR